MAYTPRTGPIAAEFIDKLQRRKMANQVQRYECKSHTSNKFWQIRFDSSRSGYEHQIITVTYGRIGTNGTEYQQDISTAGAIKIIDSKLKKGYKQVSGPDIHKVAPVKISKSRAKEIKKAINGRPSLSSLV